MQNRILAALALVVATAASPVASQTLTHSGDFQDTGWWTLNDSFGRDYPLMMFTVGGGGWDVEAFYIDFLLPTGVDFPLDAPQIQLDYHHPGATTVVSGSVLFPAGLPLGQSVLDPTGASWDLHRVSLDVASGGWELWFTGWPVSEVGYLPAGDYQIYVNPIATSSQQLIHATSGGANAVNWTTGRSYWNNGNDPYPLPGYEFVFGVTGTERPLNPSSTVPEPATMTLLASGMLGLAAARRRRQR